MTIINVAVLGSTGSVGTQTMDVIARYPERFRVHALAAGNNVELLVAQARRFNVNTVCIGNPDRYRKLKAELDESIEILCGTEGLAEIVSRPEVDLPVIAVSGALGLTPTLSAIRAKKRIALSNKESLVVGGEVVNAEVERNGAEIVPIDSEHTAIHQCLAGVKSGDLSKIILTASGGPFRTFTRDQMVSVSPRQALKHPNWSMGRKISIDSATLMNKGLEVIEAHFLFGAHYDDIEVVVHPQSIVHSLIELIDGSLLAQLGPRDMRLPILYALNYPERVPGFAGRMHLAEVGKLTFEQPDFKRFPCLALAYQAGKAGGTCPAVLNAANEVAVGRFLSGSIGFMDIPRIVETVLERHDRTADPGLEEILAADSWAREAAVSL